MTDSSGNFSLQKPNLAFAILKAALLAGTVDILIAFLQFYIRSGRSPLIVLKYIASAIYDKDALSEMNAIALGGLLHYLIAFIWTIIFFLIFPYVSLLAKKPVLSGFIYGIIIWLVMNLVVLPMSAAQAIPFNPLQALLGMLILIAAVGIPISIMANKFYLSEKSK